MLCQKDKIYIKMISSGGQRHQPLRQKASNLADPRNGRQERPESNATASAKPVGVLERDLIQHICDLKLHMVHDRDSKLLNT